ncbi:MAG: nucleotidyl transferase AbiEii/AbiGii toxin family protein [Dysgonamonadaceae bacterium]|jgi:predicted nucleotidyltransferase component of viral defense system|nr:nucleotidyl transferase AbiEii/AbiGii toxin family protein [Dysgonamonadaceae bacterium]
MAYQMNLHTNTTDFIALITFTARHFNITPAFVEKDYWITLALLRLAHSKNAESAVFKGGTSLSKGYRIINRFSEDIDIAIINENLSGNAMKTKIRNIEKEITTEMTEIVEDGITSKGSMFRKSVFEYPTILSGRVDTIIPNRIIVEINSFANPHPYIKQEITSFITEYLTENNQTEAIEEYGLQPFLLNVLDKRQTMIEKLVSLFRFSFDENPRIALVAKIRHFYDLYYLTKEEECAAYIQTPTFKKDFIELLEHDRKSFDTPKNWREKDLTQSPLITDFPALWNYLKDVYRLELTPLAFSEIPDERVVKEMFERIVENVKIKH